MKYITISNKISSTIRNVFFGCIIKVMSNLLLKFKKFKLKFMIIIDLLKCLYQKKIKKALHISKIKTIQTISSTIEN